MKPKIGQKVYLLYGTGILVEKVGYLGKDSFVIESFQYDCTERDSWEWDYDDYNVQWFTNLKEARAKLIENYRDKIDGKPKVTKISDNWYALEF